MNKIVPHLSGIFFVLLLLMKPLMAQQANEVSVKALMDNNQTQEAQTQDRDSSSKKTEFENKSVIINTPADEFQRGSPRGSIEGYLKAARNQDFELASQYLDFRNVERRVLFIGKTKLAEQLFMVLNRSLWIDLDAVSELPQGNLNEAVPSYRELLGVIELTDTKVDILLQRIPRKDDRVKIWKISNATVNKIPALAKQYGYSPVGEWLSDRLPSVGFLGVMLWQWLYFIMVAIGSYILAKFSTRLTTTVVGKFKGKWSPEVQSFVHGPFSLLIAVILTRGLIDDANKTLAVKAISEGGTLLIIAWGWVFLRSIDLFKVILAKRFVAQKKPLAVYLLRPAGNVLKSFIVIISILIWFENLGFSASTLLAGLGIGGLAIALAAQKTVENIIGAITLYTSAPVKIGNFCKFNNSVGFVEEIGLRATRIRTLERTVVYIANAQFVDMQLENFSERERIAFRPKLSLSTQCKKSDIEAFIAALTQALQDNKMVDKEPLRVNFTHFDAWALKIEVLAYINTTDYEEYLVANEQLNLMILSLLEQHNCQLSYAAEFKERLLS
jgi:MscS family membrane protein